MTSRHCLLAVWGFDCVIEVVQVSQDEDYEVHFQAHDLEAALHCVWTVLELSRVSGLLYL